MMGAGTRVVTEEMERSRRVLETILEAEPTGLESDWMLGCGRNQGGVTGAKEGLE